MNLSKMTIRRNSGNYAKPVRALSCRDRKLVSLRSKWALPVMMTLFGFGMALVSCTNEDTSSEPHSEADLTGLTLSTSHGTYYHQKYSKREDVKLFVANTEADALQAARQGLADVFVSDEVTLTREDRHRLGMKLAFRGEETFDVAFALRKGNEELQRQLNEYISSAPIKEIIAHWTDGTPSPAEPAYDIPADATPLRCICAANLSPVSYLGDGGEWMGMDPDILRRFAHSIGRPFEMSYQKFGSAIIALQTGQADVISACLFITEERQKTVDFSIPYYKCSPGYFVVDKTNDGHLGIGERIKMNLITENRWKLITGGLLETLKITFLSILLGTILGIGICSCRRSSHKWLRRFAEIYGIFINGIPILVLLLIMFYVVFAETGLNASLVAIVTFSLCFASPVGSIFDTSISSVPRGQTEAGLSLGFTPLQTFMGIVFPQALHKGLPLYIGQCVALLKSTSIVGYIAIHDLTSASDLIRSRTFDALIPLLVVTVLYFVLAWIIRHLLKLILLKK